MFVTLVGWTWSRAPTFPIGRAPRREKKSRGERLEPGEGEPEGCEGGVGARQDDLLGAGDGGRRRHRPGPVPPVALPVAAGLGDEVEVGRGTAMVPDIV